MSSERILVRDILERDPRRRIEPVIKVDEQDPQIVGSELEEYVVTEEIREYLEDIIDRFIESRSRTPESVCGWISGFFGSGKSHFLKVLGYVLSNRPIKLSDGREIGAATYFCKKHSLPGQMILEKELRTRVIFVNMLNFDRERGPSITRIAYAALLKELGLSDVFWVAEIEKMLQERGLWDQFLDFIEKETGKKWQHIRRMTAMVRPLLAKALHELDKKLYPSIKLAEKALEDVEKTFELTPRKLAEALLEEAERFGGENGRVVLLLDEVGLYIGPHSDRLTDLNILAEEIERIGRGKVWLFVTAQEAIEEVIPRVEAYRGQFEKVKDRFQIKVTLTPENIDTVVKKRLLQKTSDPNKLKKLESLYEKHSGSLATSALIKNPSREYGGLLTRLRRKDFIESYPLMPYHVRLMQEIFSLLRSRGRATPELTGRERAVLSVVRALLIGPKADVGLAHAELGVLATFDMVYDAIDVEIKAVRSEQQAAIEEIAKLGEKDGLRVDSVAKALFLLQQVSDWLPCTVENISAVLYPRLGEDKVRLEKKVRACLEELKKGKWVAEEDGKWRFLTDVERTFEQDVASKIASASEKRNLAFEIIKKEMSQFKRYNYANIRVFDVHITVDDQEITSKGQLKLCIFSPLRVQRDERLSKTLLAKSAANDDTIYWICAKEKKFEELLEKIICTEKAIRDREAKALTKDEEKTLNKYRRELETLKDEDLPRLFMNACRNGVILVQGKEIKLDGRKNVQETLNQVLKKLVEDQFPEFELAAYKVERDEHIGSILTWRRGGKLPSIYKELQLVDDKGNILIDRPVASRILQEVRRRNQEGEECTGAYLIEHFGSKPYGWDPKIVRITLATLFKNGSIVVNLDGREYVSAEEHGSHDAFTNSRKFNRARFLPGIEVSPKQRNKAWELLSEIFGLRVDNTVEEIDKGLISSLNEKIEQLTGLKAAARALELPIAEDLRSLDEVMKRIKDVPSRSKRILNFIKESETLKEKMPLLEELSQFEKRKGLEEYKKITRFLRGPGQQLCKIKKESREKIMKLMQSLESKDFIDRWSTILEDFQSIVELYSKTYSELHQKWNQQISDAIKSLSHHPIVGKLKKDELDDVIKPLNEMLCQSKKMELDDNFTCKLCNSSLERLAFGSMLIENEKMKIQSELDKKLKELEPKVEHLVGFEERIRSYKDLERVASKLKDVSERALKKGRTVSVDVRVE